MADGMQELPVPDVGADAVVGYVAQHLGHLVVEPVPTASPSFRGGQRAADAKLAVFDVAGYASTRNEVAPVTGRGASMLSPYIRHGLLSLGQVWASVAGGPGRDVAKFRDELLWQEYARHWYARHGARTRHGIRRELPRQGIGAGWDRSMRCVDASLTELETDGWLVNQTRMWLSSQWAIRIGQRWQDGEDEFFRHLVDGSRAANRLGWQWTSGVGSSKPYGFSRSQVLKRAPSLCESCEHRNRCPIESWPDEPDYVAIDTDALRESAAAVPQSALTTGPRSVERSREPDMVWLTAESLGCDDPALKSNPELPVLFIFDEPLLRRLQLSSKRLVFLVETLAEIAEHRDLRLVLGPPHEALASRQVAVTFAPVPGFQRLAGQIKPAELHPWRWLRHPNESSVASFSAWRKGLDRSS